MRAAVGDDTNRRNARGEMRSVLNTRTSSAASASTSPGSAARRRTSDTGGWARAGCIASEYGFVNVRSARDRMKGSQQKESTDRLTSYAVFHGKCRKRVQSQGPRSWTDQACYIITF